MRRTLLYTATITLVVVQWLVCAPVGGLPTPDRRTLTLPSSARQRDGLLVGSDFINTYIGTTVNPVRSRRYPISRSVIDFQQRHPYERRYYSVPMPQNRLAPLQYNAETLKSFNVNEGSIERLSGVSNFQNQPNRYSKTQSQRAYNVAHNENLQRNVDNYSVHPVDTFPNHDVVESADKDIHDVLDSENRVFGTRTVPRSSRVSMSTSSTRAVPKESFTNSFSYEVSDEVHRKSAQLIPTRQESIFNGVNNAQRHNIDEVANNPNNMKVPVKRITVPIVRSFSVSSSVQKIVSNREQVSREEKIKRKQAQSLESDLIPSTNYSEQEVINEEIYHNGQTPSSESEFTQSVTTEPTTYPDSISTVFEETSTVSTLPDTETSPTETNEEWTTKSDDFISFDTDASRTTPVTPSPTIFASYEDTPFQVVSVKVSSSMEQSQVTPQTEYTQPPITTNTEYQTPSAIIESENEAVTSRTSHSNTVTLVTEERPQAPSIQRSDFSVEESSPSEVTADPQSGYSSYYSSSFQSPTSNYYQTTSLGSVPDRQPVPSHYQTRVTTSNSGSRVQFFSKSPSYRRGLSFAPLRREGLESGSVEASVVESNRRSYSVHTLPRISVQRSSASISLSKEPVSASESIQRSVISGQIADPTPNLHRYQQNKVKLNFGRHRNFEEGKYTESPATTDSGVKSTESFRLDQPAQNSYNQHENVYSEPEKVYGEPEKVYGEPEKVYGEPEKVYGEQEKVYGESPKSYAESSNNYGVPEQNYEVDEAVSVMTNGRAHGVQPVRSELPKVTQPPVTHLDSALKIFDTRQQDPNHKFGYVVEGRDFRKYRVEERTSDGFIVGEYGVVSNDGGNLRGVRYTADGTINPRLIYDTLLKFLSL